MIAVAAAIKELKAGDGETEDTGITVLLSEEVKELAQ